MSANVGGVVSRFSQIVKSERGLVFKVNVRMRKNHTMNVGKHGMKRLRAVIFGHPHSFARSRVCRKDLRERRTDVS